MQATNATVEPASKLGPASVEVKLKLGPVTFDGLAGAAVVVVSGAPRSTVHVWLAGVRSVVPTRVGRAPGRCGCQRSSLCSSSGSCRRRKAAPSGPLEGVDRFRSREWAELRAVTFDGVDDSDHPYRHLQIDRPRMARRRRVSVSRRVGRTHLEGVAPSSQARVALQGRAGGEGGTVQAALEGGARFRRGEAEVRGGNTFDQVRRCTKWWWCPAPSG